MNQFLRFGKRNLVTYDKLYDMGIFSRFKSSLTDYRSNRLARNFDEIGPNVFVLKPKLAANLRKKIAKARQHVKFKNK